MTQWLPRLVARVPATVHAKLLAGFLVIVLLLIALGGVGLRVLWDANRRAEELVKLQRKIAAYQQLQHNTTVQLLNVASVLLVPEERMLEATLRQLNQFGYDFDRIQYVARDEAELLGQVQKDFENFTQVVNRVVELIRKGKVAEGRELQFTRARPLADRLERLMNQLVNRAEADMVASIQTSHQAYSTSRWAVIGFALASIVLALILGYAISWSLIGPLKQMDARLGQIASGDFSHQVEVPNRDELGALAANLNRMNDELGRLYQQIGDASRHKSQFLAHMSHELRTPLNAIIGFSEALLERMFGELTEKQDEYVQDILSSGRHLLSLINDILDLSKIEAGRMELDVTTFNLLTAIGQALGLIRERASRKNIGLTSEIDERLGDIAADERKVKQVLLNLLSNAVKFTPEGGKISIRARLDGHSAEISVRDTGIGIAPENQEAIFEQFRQLGDDREREGTGLGLTLSRKFVELHGGRIWVESEIGRGSTFTFTLLREADKAPPVRAGMNEGILRSLGEGGYASEGSARRSAVKAATAVKPGGSTLPIWRPVRPSSAAEEIPSSSGNPLVLVVEDDAQAADWLSIYLMERGFRLEVAPDVEIGLEMARKLRPSMITLDLLMRSDGWEFLHRMKESLETRQVPIIIASLKDQGRKGFAFGVAGLLAKPLKHEELAAAVQCLLPVEVHGRAMKALVVDDDPKALALVQTVLQARGYQTLQASGVKEGAALLRKELPQLMALNLLLPDADGVSVLDLLCDERPGGETPVAVLISRAPTAEEKQRLNGRISDLARTRKFNPERLAHLAERLIRQ